MNRHRWAALEAHVLDEPSRLVRLGETEGLLGEGGGLGGRQCLDGRPQRAFVSRELLADVGRHVEGDHHRLVGRIAACQHAPFAQRVDQGQRVAFGGIEPAGRLPSPVLLVLGLLLRFALHLLILVLGGLRLLRQPPFLPLSLSL